MGKKYNRDKKEKLVNRINKLRSTEDFVKVYNIIQKRESLATKEVEKSTMMFFHDLKDDTYAEIDKFVKKTIKKYDNNEDSVVTTDLQEYQPYSQDEFPHQKHINPKLKYSNRERNLIKRTQYNRNLQEENGSEVMYCQFDVNNLTDTMTETENGEDVENEEDAEINEPVKKSTKKAIKESTKKAIRESSHVNKMPTKVTKPKAKRK